METTAIKKDDVLRQKLISVLSSLSGFYPNPDDAPKPGPWDPIIRKAFAKYLGPHPDPWRSGPFPDPWRIAGRHSATFDLLASVALNPQPLPPRESIVIEVARQAVDRFTLAQEIADLTTDAGGERGIIIVGGKISQFVDDYCGTVFPKRFPIPPPKGTDDDRFSGTELILAGVQFLNGVQNTSNEGLRGEFQKAGERLVDEGLKRL